MIQVLWWLLFGFALVLTVSAVWLAANEFRAWLEIRRGWRKLRSGEWRVYGNGVEGFVAVHAKPPYWWIRRNETTVIEGYAPTIDAAKLEVDGEATWLVTRR